jgi:hypothetical protein
MSETAIVTFEWDGKYRDANVKPVTGDFENMFWVVMDDGYENHFFITDDRPYTWYEAHVGYTDLAQAVGRAIEHIFFLNDI